MPELSLQDDAHLHWEASGEGPRVLLLGFNYTEPEVFDGLVEELAGDHTVLTVHLRGTGSSSWEGPYGFESDQRDLKALLEQTGGARLAVGFGDGGIRAIRLGAARPDLLEIVVCSGSPGLPARTEGSQDAMSGSREVLRALLRLIETDYRAGIRSIIGGGGNPGLSEDEIRERVERVTTRCSHEAVVARMAEWIHDDATPHAKQLGARLWILHYPGNPWFPEELMTGLHDVLPEAHFEPVAEGGMRRPDLTAAVVRRILAG